MRDYTEEELKMLSELLPNIAQQLRVGMSTMYTAVDRLIPPETRENDPEADRTAAVFCQSYYSLYRTASNLTEAGRFFADRRLELYDDDIVGLCRHVCREAEFLFELCGVTLDFAADRDSRIIGMDADALRRLLMNLLSNALKFTPSGGTVRVRVRAEGRVVKLIVSDNGCGISPDRLDHIFDRFLQPNGCDPAPHGLGLGLPICQRIAQGHGGLLFVDSEEGEGSTFTVSLPAVCSGRVRMRDSGSDYAGGFNRTLVELADALPAEAFLQKYLD